MADVTTELDEPGWLGRELAAAAAEVATWDEGLRGQSLSSLSDQAILGGIRLLDDRLEKLQAEASRRNLVR